MAHPLLYKLGRSRLEEGTRPGRTLLTAVLVPWPPVPEKDVSPTPSWSPWSRTPVQEGLAFDYYPEGSRGYTGAEIQGEGGHRRGAHSASYSENLRRKA